MLINSNQIVGNVVSDLCIFIFIGFRDETKISAGTTLTGMADQMNDSLIHQWYSQCVQCYFTHFVLIREWQALIPRCNQQLCNIPIIARHFITKFSVIVKKIDMWYTDLPPLWLPFAFCLGQESWFYCMWSKMAAATDTNNGKKILNDGTFSPKLPNLGESQSQCMSFALI